MTPKDSFIQAAANMESALASSLNAVNSTLASHSVGGKGPDLEKILKLIIKKEIVLGFLIEEITKK